MDEHWFWFLLTLACVLWYSTITIYVAVKGWSDIRGMLERLSRSGQEAGESASGGQTRHE
jgi:hypothetical protein